MKSLIEFSQVLLNELGQRCGVSTPRDCKTVTSRVECEGLSFLTITLPAFAKDFERSLEAGAVADDAFLGFSRLRGLPRFLGGFLQLVFDSKTGILLDSPSIDAVRSIRQFCMAFGKIELPCSDERVNSAFREFVECDRNVDAVSSALEGSALADAFAETAAILYRDLFTEIDLAVYQGEIVPRHGSGSTAEKILGNQKFSLRSWTTRLDDVFPVADFALPNHRYWAELSDVNIAEPGAETPVRVVSVPKTLKTPRIIAIEPVAMQYAQQGLRERFMDGIERDNLLSPIIGFTSQTENRLMAKKGSIDGSLATLDLSEASDRVSWLHVRLLLRSHPWLAKAVDATRSRKADVPGAGVVTLSKFASMGSALCFPMEAMVFTTIIVMTIARELSVPVSPRLVRSLAGRVRVYGDDIIVPVDFAPAVMSSLEAFGLKVNHRKSFRTGRFRESCGGDYYAGEWVTPVRVRSVFPSSRKQAAEVVSTVSLRNQLFQAGFVDCVDYLDNLMHRVLPVYPELPVGHPALGRWVWNPVSGSRTCPDLQVPLVKAPVVKADLPVDELEGHGALMKFFLRRGSEPLSKDSFRRAGRPSSVRITTRWIPVQLYGDGAA